MSSCNHKLPLSLANALDDCVFCLEEKAESSCKHETWDDDYYTGFYCRNCIEQVSEDWLNSIAPRIKELEAENKRALDILEGISFPCKMVQGAIIILKGSKKNDE